MSSSTHPGALISYSSSSSSFLKPPTHTISLQQRPSPLTRAWPWIIPAVSLTSSTRLLAASVSLRSKLMKPTKADERGLLLQQQQMKQQQQMVDHDDRHHTNVFTSPPTKPSKTLKGPGDVDMREAIEADETSSFETSTGGTNLIDHENDGKTQRMKREESSPLGTPLMKEAIAADETTAFETSTGGTNLIDHDREDDGDHNFVNSAMSSPPPPPPPSRSTTMKSIRDESSSSLKTPLMQEAIAADETTAFETSTGGSNLIDHDVDEHSAVNVMPPLTSRMRPTMMSKSDKSSSPLQTPLMTEAIAADETTSFETSTGGTNLIDHDDAEHSTVNVMPPPPRMMQQRDDSSSPLKSPLMKEAIAADESTTFETSTGGTNLIDHENENMSSSASGPVHSAGPVKMEEFFVESTGGAVFVDMLNLEKQATAETLTDEASDDATAAAGEHKSTPQRVVNLYNMIIPDSDSDDEHARRLAFVAAQVPSPTDSEQIVHAEQLHGATGARPEFQTMEERSGGILTTATAPAPVDDSDEKGDVLFQDYTAEFRRGGDNEYRMKSATESDETILQDLKQMYSFVDSALMSRLSSMSSEDELESVMVVDVDGSPRPLSSFQPLADYVKRKQMKKQQQHEQHMQRHLPPAPHSF